jgi:catechol 2,3-dioxygenase-like lactoylglutathione lyase family enzyme
MNQTITVERVDHIGIRVRDLDRALRFYGVLGFELLRRAEGDDVAIVRNENGVELNLISNAKSWPGESGQGDKWIFCLNGGTDGRGSGERDDETGAPESHTGIQGEGGVGRCEG